MKTVLRASMDGITKIAVEFPDQEGEPNHEWYCVLKAVAEGHRSFGYGEKSAPEWVRLIRMHYPKAAISVDRD